MLLPQDVQEVPGEVGQQLPTSGEPYEVHVDQLPEVVKEPGDPHGLSHSQSCHYRS